MNRLFNATISTPSPFSLSEYPLVNKSLFIFVGVLLLSISAQLSIPFKPVPLSIQSTTVILIAMMYGARSGAYVILGYFMAGIAGVPVFADFTFGITKFIGPTGGYLIGFLPAAIVSGYLSQNGWTKNWAGSLLTALIGITIIFFCGVSLLSLTFGFTNAIQIGLMPFILSESVKIIIVSLVITKIKPLSIAKASHHG